MSHGDDSYGCVSEERLHLSQKLLVRAVEAIAEQVGMHVMVYTSYMYNGEPAVTS